MTDASYMARFWECSVYYQRGIILFGLTYMPKLKLNNNQMITIGAKVLAILLVPSGWIRKMTIKIAQETPMTVEDEISGLTTVMLDRLVAVAHEFSIAHIPLNCSQYGLSWCQNAICFGSASLLW